jgi:hypothetical protein
MLKIILCLFISITASANSVLIKKLNYKSIEDDFLVEKDLKHKSELAYVLANSPLESKLTNNLVYYAKYALRFENDLQTEQVCELNLILGNYFQDIFSYESSIKHYLAVKDNCSKDIIKYKNMRVAWNNYSLGSKKKALSEFEKLANVNPSDNEINNKIGYVWADIFINSKNTIINNIDINNANFIKGVISYIQSSDSGELTQNKVYLLNRLNPALSNEILKKINITVRNSCDLKYLLRLKGLEESILHEKIIACDLTNKYDPSVMLKLISMKKEKQLNDFILEGKYYSTMSKKVKSCHSFQQALHLTKKDSLIIADGLLDNCSKGVETKFFNIKNFSFRMIKDRLLVLLKNDFSVLSYSQIRKILIKEEKEQIGLSILESKSMFDSFYDDFMLSSEYVRLSYLMKYSSSLEEKKVERIINTITRIDLLASLIGASIDVKAGITSYKCQKNITDQIKPFYYIGLLKSGFREELIQCTPSFYLFNEDVYNAYLDSFQLNTKQVKFGKSSVVSVSGTRSLLPNYRTLIPKNNFINVRKSLHLTETIRKLELFQISRFTTEYEIFKQLSEFKTLRSKINKNKWQAKNLLAVTKYLFKDKVSRFQKSIIGTKYEQNKIISFLENVADV